MILISDGKNHFLIQLLVNDEQLQKNSTIYYW